MATTTTTATVTATATATAWAIDPTHSTVEFSVRHLMIATVKGRFAGVRGTVTQADDNDPSTAAVEVTIDAASIDTREAQRDAHLRSADFFDVESYPVITFKSRKVSDVRGDSFKLTGDLTIRGIAREVTLDVTAHGRAADPWGGQRAGFEAAGKIKRSEFGLTWNQALETGGVVVGDEIKIAIDAELVRQG